MHYIFYIPYKSHCYQLGHLIERCGDVETDIVLDKLRPNSFHAIFSKDWLGPIYVCAQV